MRIAVISTMSALTVSGMPWGGSEELWAEMADAALHQSFEVMVSIRDSPYTPPKVLALEQKGAQVSRRRRLPEWQRFSRLRKLLRRFQQRDKLNGIIGSPFQSVFSFKPDVICISQGWTYEASSLTDLLNLLYSSAIPYVVVCQFNHDGLIPDRTTREASLEFLERAARVVFVSHRNLKSVERQLAKTLPNGLVLQNPVNLFDLTPVAWPSSGLFHMASVARLDVAYKGQDVLFEVLGSGSWRHRDWCLCLYGEGPDRNYLAALAQHYGIEQRIKFCGYTGNIRSIWAENQFLVLPSRAEGTPLALIEALLCGRPAVVTDVGDNAEWVEEPQTGFVAEAPTASSFGAALERAWLARSDWKRMGTQAHKQTFKKLDKTPGKSLLEVLLRTSRASQAG